MHARDKSSQGANEPKVNQGQADPRRQQLVEHLAVLVVQYHRRTTGPQGPPTKPPNKER